MWRVKEPEESDESKVLCFSNDKMDFPFVEFRKPQEDIWGKIRSFVLSINLGCLSFIKIKVKS